MGRYVTNEGEKIMELRKRWRKNYFTLYRWNGQFRFSEEEILTILRSSLHEKGRRANDRVIKIENLWKRYGLKAVIRELNIEITEGKL